jgi:xanthine dehydrogenase accessory factor
MDVLHASGFGAEALSRLCSPAGLNLGAGTPMETAVAIVSEILSVRSQTPSHHTGPFPAFTTT